MKKAHNVFMRFTCNLCLLILIFTALCGGVYAFTGFNILYLLCFQNRAVYLSVLAVNGIAALFTLYALILFKPFKGLK